MRHYLLFVAALFCAFLLLPTTATAQSCSTCVAFNCAEDGPRLTCQSGCCPKYCVSSGDCPFRPASLVYLDIVVSRSAARPTLESARATLPVQPAKSTQSKAAGATSSRLPPPSKGPAS